MDRYQKKEKIFLGLNKEILKRILIVLISLLITILTVWLGDFGKDFYKIDFSAIDLKKDINSIISADSTIRNLDEFKKKYSFSKNTKNKLDQLNNDDKNLNDLDLMQLYFVVKEKYPSEIEQFITRESDKWHTWFYIIIIFILSSMLTWSISFLILGKEKIQSATNKSFKLIFEHFTKTYDGFLSGILENYPVRYISVFNSIDLEESYENKTVIEELREQIKTGKRSLYILLREVTLEQYSDIAKGLLDISKRSIKSTTYYNNDEFIYSLNDNQDKDKVKSWIDDVNKSGLDISRVHIFKNATKSKAYDEFINTLKKQENNIAKHYYLNSYVNIQDRNIKYNAWFLDQKSNNGKDAWFPKAGKDILFYGECILFDEQVMIKFDKDFSILELFIGSVVKAWSINFDHIRDKENNNYTVISKDKFKSDLENKNV